jgi:hypothetical protein
MRASYLIVALPVVLFAALTSLQAHRPLDPDEPIAADGSLAAGRALTIFDFEPMLGAFDDPNAHEDFDDPKNFQERLEIEKNWTDHSREPIARLLGPLDASSCEDANRKRLIAAVRTYYDVRGRQKHSFALRGPQATAAIECEWSTPLDQRIDAFVREAVQSGFLHKRDVPERSFPEFANVLAGRQEIGAACPPLKTERRLPAL